MNIRSLLSAVFLCMTVSLMAQTNASECTGTPDDAGSTGTGAQEEVADITPRQLALRGYELMANPASTPEQRREGLELTIQSAIDGDPVGMANLGFVAAYGGDGLVIPDAEKALYWYGRAIDEGMTSAAHNLLDLQIHHPALEIPDETLAKAHLLMGEAYAKGKGPMGYSFEESQKHYLAAARLGNRQAIEVIREILGMYPDALGELSQEDLEIIFRD